MLTLTPDLLAVTYDLLRHTEPFRRWRLPAASALKFKVTRSKDEFGYCEHEGTTLLHIACSDRKHGQLPALLMTMAHEMVHVRLALKDGHKAPAHGAEFQRHADRVCRIHGFDRKTF